MAFSCLRQIHSWLRTTTTGERLGKLVVLALHGFDIPVMLIGIVKVQTQGGYRIDELYVEWGSTNTTDTSVFMMKISHILKCEGK